MGVAITPDGTKAYVTNIGSFTVSVINTATNVAIGSPIPLGNGQPYAVAITPNGDYAYVAGAVPAASTGSVSVIDTATDTVSATVSGGTNPRGIAITPDGAYAYSTGLGSDDVSVIDTATNTVSTTISVGDAPYGIAICPAAVVPPTTTTTTTTPTPITLMPADPVVVLKLTG